MNTHLNDMLRVAGVNIAALFVSLSSVEDFFRIGGLAAAFVYTLLKIYDWFRGR